MALSGCGNLSRVRYGQETVKMAVLPAPSLGNMTESYLPLLRYLSSETGYDVQYVSSNSYGGFGATVEGSDVHLVLCDPLCLLTLRKSARAEVMAIGLGPGGAVRSPGLIVVRVGAGISEISGLKGKKVGLASQRSAEGFLSQALTLKAHGIDARRDLRLVTCGNMDEVVGRLRERKIDAGFIGLAAWDEAYSADLAVLSRTEPVNNWAVAALPGTAPEIRSKIQAALLSMGPGEEHQRILGRLRLEGFAAPAGGSWDDLARAADKAGVPY
jgi:ABC-type phosphate/phosphonate transport system substrate-binding protein